MKRIAASVISALVLVLAHAHVALADIIGVEPGPLDEPEAPVGIIVVAVAAAIAAVVGIYYRTRKK